MAHGLFRLATAGSVDDGKSTLVGRLLHDAKAILADSLDDIRRVSAERGFGGDEPALDLALVTDGLRAEREQGITIDVAYRYFTTPARSFILADCPGHVQYTRNTVTGASTADAAVVLVDARNGVVEQTRRHLGVLGLLRVPQVIVAVNKMDLIGWDASAFAALESQVTAVARELDIESVTVIPVSALDGDNVVDRGVSAPWYTGPTLLELLETLPVAVEQHVARLDVQLVIRPQGALQPGYDAEAFRDFRGYAGTVSGGSLRVGDAVQVLSAGRPYTASIEGLRSTTGPIEAAHAGDAVVVELDADIDVARGDTIVAGELSEPTREFAAEVCLLSDVPVGPGQRVLIKHGAQVVQAKVEGIDHVLRVSDFSKHPADRLGLNDLGLVRLRTAVPLAVTDYRDSRTAGSFLMIDPQDGTTLAAGMIESDAGAAHGAADGSRVPEHVAA
ncbi:sulfate adenylyltransferase subunit 1 [Zhihengliuella salsuginis]|uniref:sulfate adenylyltransferase n=1 Tax=Zhihengliuella salsuginis TaxID=578222 RepID=A0ABQ3GCQ6_9MICC|nr:GTP-binding protein [Zhihengliuella salsuginis]GHD01849.1 sulfate adenylyltransferase subunit 1 [Zhihengliuella salsuginis]